MNWRYQLRKQQGVCTRCGMCAATGATLCSRHLEAARQYARAYRAKRRERRQRLKAAAKARKQASEAKQ